MVKVTANETNPEGGGGISHDCDVHLMVEKVETSEKEGETSVKCEFVVLASTVKEEINKKINEFFACSGKAAGKFLNLAVAAGLTTKVAWAAAKEAGQEMEIDETQLKGRQICAQIRMEPYRGQDPKHLGKKFGNIGFRTYHVFSDEAKLIPKDTDAVSLLGPPPPNDSGTAGNGAKLPTQPTNPPAGAGASQAASALDATW